MMVLPEHVTCPGIVRMPGHAGIPGFLRSWRGRPSRLNSGPDPALTGNALQQDAIIPAIVSGVHDLALRFNLADSRLDEVWNVGNSHCGFDREVQGLFGSPCLGLKAVMRSLAHVDCSNPCYGVFKGTPWEWLGPPESFNSVTTS